jgi:anti-sigma factor (TIGR02949 family)
MWCSRSETRGSKIRNVINFNDKTCERIRRYFDSYLDNELLVETNHEVLRHLSACPDCTKALDARVRLKQSVKRAVEQEMAPAVLLESIQNGLRERRSFFDFDLRRWAMAATVLVILAAGVSLLCEPVIFLHR